MVSVISVWSVPVHPLAVAIDVPVPVPVIGLVPVPVLMQVSWAWPSGISPMGQLVLPVVGLDAMVEAVEVTPDGPPSIAGHDKKIASNKSLCPPM